jgi:DNA-binding NtrC family response regulator
MPANRLPDLLLVEPETLLRRTIAMTAHGAQLAHMHEATNAAAARGLLSRRRFDGAVVALDLDTPKEQGGPLAMLDLLQDARSPADAAIPVAVMVDRCDAMLLASLRTYGVSRVIIKPVRARVVIEAIADLGRAVRTG